MKYEIDDNLTPVERWVALKELESEIKLQLKLLEDDVKETVDNGQTNQVTRVYKETVKMNDSIVKFLHNKGLLNLVRKDDIDLNKVKQLVSSGVIEESELEEHLTRKQSSYLKKKVSKK